VPYVVKMFKYMVEISKQNTARNLRVTFVCYFFHEQRASARDGA